MGETSQLIRVSRPALGSGFEIYLGGEDIAMLEAVGNAALDRVLWLEQQLSHFLPDSEICQINRRAFAEPVTVSPALLALLLRLRHWSEITEGAFDPTAGKLVRAWGFFRRGQAQGETVPLPDADTIAEIVRQIGWQNVELNEKDAAIRFLTPSVELHLGAVGKGYIVQCAADFLRSEGIERALLHSGQSSVVAIGAPPDSEGWPISIPDPYNSEERLAVVTLSNAALSTSGTAEQFVQIDGKRYSHLFDPRTGFPIPGFASLSVLSTDAAEGDALSTAFFVQGEAWTETFCQSHPNVGVALVSSSENRTEKSNIRCFGNVTSAGMRVERVE